MEREDLEERRENEKVRIEKRGKWVRNISF
jgi:hypothetical protein